MKTTVLILTLANQLAWIKRS